MEDFDQMWNEQIVEEPSPIELDEETPEYQLKDGTAKYKLLCNMLGLYYHAKYGEPMDDIFTETQNNEINFHL